jgi:hypothetical protein
VPPRSDKSARHDKDLPHIVHALLPSLSTLGSPETTAPSSFTPSLPDLETLLTVAPDDRFFDLITKLVTLIVDKSLSLIPLLKWKRHAVSREHLRQLQLRARVNLGIVESVSMMVIVSWRMQKERGDMEQLLKGETFLPITALAHGYLPLDLAGFSSFIQGVKAESSKTHKSRTKPRAGSGRRDSIEELERRRGGSPPARRAAHLSGRAKPGVVQSARAAALSRTTRHSVGSDPSERHQDGTFINEAFMAPRQRQAVTTGHQPPLSHRDSRDSSDTSVPDPVPRRHRRRSTSSDVSPLQRPRSMSHGTKKSIRSQSPSSVGSETRGLLPRGIIGPVDQAVSEMGGYQKERVGEKVVLLSEDRRGWWMYLSVLGCAIVAVLLGLRPDY